MLHALVHRKLDGELKRDPHAIEDLLTSVVFGACEYSGDTGVLLNFLGCARTVEGQPLAPKLREVTQVGFELWPTWERSLETAAGDGGVLGGEPDVVLRLEHADGARSIVLVEAKLWSGKSSHPSDHGPVTDQLAKYWLGLKTRAEHEQRAPLALVYLVVGTTAPLADLAESQAELRAKGHAEAPFYWLSWRRFANLAQSASHPILRDTVRLLRDGWQLFEIEMGTWPSPVAAPVWTVELDIRWPARSRPPEWSFDQSIRWPLPGSPPRWSVE